MPKHTVADFNHQQYDTSMLAHTRIALCVLKWHSAQGQRMAAGWCKLNAVAVAHPLTVWLYVWPHNPAGARLQRTVPAGTHVTADKTDAQLQPMAAVICNVGNSCCLHTWH